VLRALIWDVDGTFAETERDGHRVAFNDAFAALGIPWRWDVDTYGRLLRVTGGYERILHDMANRAEAPASQPEREALARELHRRKNVLYEARVATGGIALRPGVRALIDECIDWGVMTAIATTTGRGNVDALLRANLGEHWASRFRAVVCAEDAPRKKPDPQAYLLALQRLGIEADEAIAIEDSPNGLAAARAAGIATLVTRSAYFDDCAFDGALAECDDLASPAPVRSSVVPFARGPVSLRALREWLAFAAGGDKAARGARDARNALRSH
jgi:beta-phosphoglucomutase-like phosphatase (HAD superfamily)